MSQLERNWEEVQIQGMSEVRRFESETKVGDKPTGRHRAGSTPYYNADHPGLSGVGGTPDNLLRQMSENAQL